MPKNQVIAAYIALLFVVSMLLIGGWYAMGAMASALPKRWPILRWVSYALGLAGLIAVIVILVLLRVNPEMFVEIINTVEGWLR